MYNENIMENRGEENGQKGKCKKEASEKYQYKKNRGEERKSYSKEEKKQYLHTFFGDPDSVGIGDRRHISAI